MTRAVLAVHPSTRDHLNRLKTDGETTDDLLRRLMGVKTLPRRHELGTQIVDGEQQLIDLRDGEVISRAPYEPPNPYTGLPNRTQEYQAWEEAHRG